MESLHQWLIRIGHGYYGIIWSRDPAVVSLFWNDHYFSVSMWAFLLLLVLLALSAWLLFFVRWHPQASNAGPIAANKGGAGKRGIRALFYVGRTCPALPDRRRSPKANSYVQVPIEK